MNSFYQSALDIAGQKLFRDPRPTRLGTFRGNGWILQQTTAYVLNKSQ